MVPYRVYSEFLKDKFGEKVYKLPVNLNGTCPNRDGSKAYGGCIFCGESGGSFENKDGDIRRQLELSKITIEKKYKAKKFIAYFQNYTSTYEDLYKFKSYVEEAKIEGVVGFSFSTRPDCLGDDFLDYFQDLSKDYFVTLEVGLQTVNYKSLKLLNRGHGLSDFIDSSIRAKKRNLRLCVHMILDLPWDDMDDVVEGARVLSALSIDEVKLHSLYVVKGTRLASLYDKGEVQLLDVKTYKERVINFLLNLDQNIVVQRLVGRAPQEDTIIANYNTSWWKIRDDIINEMYLKGLSQGQLRKGGKNG